MNEDEIRVEMIYPRSYVEYNIATMQAFTKAAALHCQAAATIGQEIVEFELPGITVAQIGPLEKAMKIFRVEMVHDYVGPRRIPHFVCDVRGLMELQREMED